MAGGASWGAVGAVERTPWRLESDFDRPRVDFGSPFREFVQTLWNKIGVLVLCLFPIIFEGVSCLNLVVWSLKNNDFVQETATNTFGHVRILLI